MKNIINRIQLIKLVAICSYLSLKEEIDLFPAILKINFENIIIKELYLIIAYGDI